MPRTSAWLACLLACAACDSKRPAPASEYVAPANKGDSGAFMLPPSGPPPDDAGGYCGRLFIPIVVERPNFYFVVDVSGSMENVMDKPNSDGVIPTRYDAARAAIREVLKSVGHRVNYGAALFPAPDSSLATCPTGQEVFPTQPGDDVSFRVSGEIGPVLNKLIITLRRYAPAGLTPTAASLRALEPKLLALPGKTFVFLLTDGAPNCNEAAACGPDQCTINLEGGCDPTQPRINCCDPAVGVGSSLNCADADPTIAAVASLAKKKIPTFVIGMPGTIAYRNLLDDLATAGGTSQISEPYYYPVDGTDTLTQVLETIGLSLTIRCEAILASPPPDPALVNVYFDKRVVTKNDENGWRWGPTDGGASADGAGSDGGATSRIEIIGEACDELKRGDVIEVQVVAGCPSVVK